MRKNFSFPAFFLAAVALILAFWYFKEVLGDQKDFKETPHIAQKVSDFQQSKHSVGLLVFYKDGCPYCHAGKKSIEKMVERSKFPVYFVNTESSDGQKIVTAYQVKYASTLVLLKKDKVGNLTIEKLSYADKVAGEYVPLTKNIAQVEKILGGKK